MVLSTRESTAGAGQLVDGQAVGAEQPIDGIGGLGCQELALGVGPEVFRGARDQNGTGSDEGDQLVLINGQLVLAIIELLEVAAEPVRKRGVEVGHGLAEDAAGQRRAAGA